MYSLARKTFYGNSEYFFDIAVLGSSLDGLFADAFGDSLSISLDSTIFGSTFQICLSRKRRFGMDTALQI